MPAECKISLKILHLLENSRMLRQHRKTASAIDGVIISVHVAIVYNDPSLLFSAWVVGFNRIFLRNFTIAQKSLPLSCAHFSLFYTQPHISNGHGYVKNNLPK